MRACVVFTWRGVPIRDIRAWAAERGERMVPYRAWRLDPGFCGQMILHEEFGEMPQHFWDHLAITDGWHYEEIDRLPFP